MLRKLLFIFLLPLSVMAQEAIYDSYVLAPGWTKLSFEPTILDILLKSKDSFIKSNSIFDDNILFTDSLILSCESLPDLTALYIDCIVLSTSIGNKIISAPASIARIAVSPDQASEVYYYSL